MNDVLFEKLIDIDNYKISFIMEATQNQFRNNLLESQYKIIKDNGNKEDFLYLYTEAKEDFKQRMQSIIKKIRDEAVKLINQISYNVSKFMTQFQLKVYSKNVEAVENFLINKIGLSTEEAITFTTRFSNYSAILEKKMMVYDKFTTMVEQKNIRGETITDEELDQFERALNEVDLQFRDQKKVIRPNYTTYNLYKKSFNPEFYKFMALRVDKTYSVVKNKMDNDSNPNLFNRLTSFFKRQFDDISVYLKNTSAAMKELKDIGRKYHVQRDTSSEEKMAETMYILNELERIDINNAKLKNNVDKIRIQADSMERLGNDYNDPDLLAAAENLRNQARIAQREANYYTRNAYNDFYGYY